ncbi:MAG: aldose 1-epimerase family protein [Clostridia bacterium]|nr:aldose 1-epimerase family protein [Clostridia bacterium]
MIYTIENEYVKIAVDTVGAQLQSLYSKKSGVEYLWQGDSNYWAGRAYNLFPVIGRMYKGTYLYQNREYQIGAHGVARSNVFYLEDRSATKLVFLLTDNRDTYKEYPFRFEFRVIFTLENYTLNVRYEAKNLGKNEMICAFGGHPGINVPFGDGMFEDYYLEFSEKTKVTQELLSENKFMSGERVLYDLQNGVKLPLKHGLFDNDALIFSNTSRCVSLKSKKDSKYVTMRYSDFPYIGFWHSPFTDAPFVCLEPWTALPADEGITTVLETKPNMTKIPAAKSAGVSYSLEIHE